MASVVVKIHPHRANFGENALPKWYVHVSSWGPAARPFHSIETIPVVTDYIYNGAGCGCVRGTAQGWCEIIVEESQIDWSEDGRTFYIR